MALLLALALTACSGDDGEQEGDADGNEVDSVASETGEEQTDVGDDEVSGDEASGDEVSGGEASGDGEASDNRMDELEGAVELSEADVEFLHFLLAYDAQLVEIMEIVRDRSDRDELVEFAEEEIDFAEQGQQLTRFTLAAGGVETEPGEVDGLVDAAKIAELETLSGLEFDLAALDVLRAHADAERDAAERALENGATGEIAGMAEDSIEFHDTSLYDLWEDMWTEESN
ncbi:hypothetical protein EF847_18160 [Actinobacteria bacterium YIM 96077]|uniref:DUF305 domain-containing protein n=2 Tax=Phytoactinopolyspora halophila TaxID=1981511 RepID=A0A329QTI6_9ACTN|nr:hypothetical protein EF847_18160 [Actinobacteria bacterium YIM 96077]RAW14879.1 hypothetical protein DPM12_10375 [Phytoactinopolyspora halophila]